MCQPEPHWHPFHGVNRLQLTTGNQAVVLKCKLSLVLVLNRLRGDTDVSALTPNSYII